MKRIIEILVWSILFTGIIILLSFVSIEHKKIECKSFDISLDYGDDNFDIFLTADEIKEKIYQITDTLPGQLLANIDVELIENEIKNIPYVADAEVYSTINGNIKSIITQRKAMVKIINHFGESYYLDNEQNVMPLSKKHSAHVLIASGYIGHKLQDTIKNNSTIKNVYTLAKAIINDEFFKAQIEQIYINKKNEIELIPKVGNHIIIFGSINNIDEKLEKLMLFYTKGLKKTGWNKYKTVNLKYRNQIVCTKI
ncbi:cell division protein FtsQ/DivIB [Bacteroidota bacterium]